MSYSVPQPQNTSGKWIYSTTLNTMVFVADKLNNETPVFVNSQANPFVAPEPQRMEKCTTTMPLVQATSVVSFDLEPENKLCVVPQSVISCLPTDPVSRTSSVEREPTPTVNSSHKRSAVPVPEPTKTVDTTVVDVPAEPIEFPGLPTSGVVRSRHTSASSSVTDSGMTSVSRCTPSVKDFPTLGKDVSSRRCDRSRSTSVSSVRSNVSRNSSTRAYDTVYQNLKTNQKTKFVVLIRDTVLREGSAMDSKQLRIIYANTVLKINMTQFVFTMHQGMERKRVQVVAPFQGWISVETAKGKLFSDYEHKGSKTRASMNFAGKSRDGEIPRVVMPAKFNGAECSTHTALVCIPPKKFWPRIEAIRKKNDGDFERWMPHINLFFPFIANSYRNDDLTDFTEEVLRPICSQMKPFKVNLNKFSTYGRGKRCEVAVGPDRVNGFVALFKSIQESLPKTVAKRNRGFYKPRLTLGQFNKRSVDRYVQNAEESWRSIPWKVDRVYVVEKTHTTPYRVKDIIYLGATGVKV